MVQLRKFSGTSPDRDNVDSKYWTKQRTTQGPDTRKQRSVQYNLDQNSLNREYMTQQRTTQGPDTRKWWGDQNSLNREYPSKQRTTRGPDTLKRKGDQYNPHQSTLGR